MKSDRHWDDFLESRFDQFCFLHGSEIAEASFDTVFLEDTPVSETHNPTQAGPAGKLLFYGEGMELTPYALRKLSRYLCAIPLLSDTDRVAPGHFEYWRCTGAYASRLLTELESRQRHLEHNTESGGFDEDDILSAHGWTIEHSFTEVDIHELCLLIQIGLLGSNQISSLAESQSTHMMNVMNRSFQIASRFGFPVLEDLTDRLADRGNRIQNNIRYWFEETENTETARVLLEFNRMGDFMPHDDSSVISHLNNLVTKADLRDRSGLIRGGGFVRKLHQNRGDTLHGGISRGVAVVAITLCCLAFWDAITDDQYESVKERLALDLATGPTEWELLEEGRSWNPFDFYPHYHGRLYEEYDIKRH
jgi:hypothetical protein